MKKKIKKYGGSLVITFTKEDIEFHPYIKEGEVINIKVSPENKGDEDN